MNQRASAVSLALSAVLCLSPCARAANDGVIDSSYRTAAGERVIELSVVVNAPVDDV
jgi:hypothetical protein